MNLIHKYKESFKEVVESYLKREFEVIFVNDEGSNLGEITKNTPYKVVNLYEEIYSHMNSCYVTEIGKRVYIKVWS